MKMKYTMAALIASAMSLHAATTLHDLAVSGGVGNQSNNSGEFNITFTTDALNGGIDINLLSVDLSGPNTGQESTTFFLELALDADNNAITQGTSGGVLATSTGSVLAVNVINTFSFAGVTLTPNTVYNLRFTDEAGNAVTPRMGLSNGDNDQGTEMFENGNSPRYDGAFDAPITVNMVPEPSSTALLGLGGLALILRRRK